MDAPSGGRDGDVPVSNAGPHPHVTDIAHDGDVILDITFEQSKETLKSGRRAIVARASQTSTRPVSKPKIKMAYRVSLSILKKQSKYFNNLLGDARFEEAKTVREALANLSLRNLTPAQAEVRDLPWIGIVDDDDATRSTGREVAFGDLLRILHAQETVTKLPTMLYVTILAVLADRFACTAPVSRYLATGLKFKWPATRPKHPQEAHARLSLEAEELLRQKILVSWLLDQPLKFRSATKELILYGSRSWGAYVEQNEAGGAIWWDLPDDLERELQYRRECILNSIASVQSHFLSLYTSRARQCKLGYDSSAACDSFQLGEMVKFLSNKKLLFLLDFSPRSAEAIPDLSCLEIGQFLATLKQCPSYQIDKNHTNCGLRTRILPILDYMQTMLSSNIISISRPSWKNDRASDSWYQSSQKIGPDGGEYVFRFTRSLAGDQRLRYEGAMAVDRFARELFTATDWDWTPED